MRKIKEIDVIWYEFVSDLCRSVNYSIKEGWKPLGGASYNSCNKCYFITMVKYENEADERKREYAKSQYDASYSNYDWCSGMVAFAEYHTCQQTVTNKE